MQAHFLLGPAGSGKTFRCLAEIRAALRGSPQGPPLVLLAPRQATFQLERQLLAVGEISGYTRLHIFSFERLAQFVLDALGVMLPAERLTEEGRSMVLHALLRRHKHALKLFGPSAGRPGFARQLGWVFDELQQHQYSAARLRTLAQHAGLNGELQHKLQDLALLLDAYAGWLAERGLQDTGHLLDEAAVALRSPSANRQAPFAIQGLWLDGFAEMTPQELDLLAGLVPYCERATLAFCLAKEPEAGTSWLSLWSPVRSTFQRCHGRIAEQSDVRVTVEWIAQLPEEGRFAGNPALHQLAQGWPQPAHDAESRTPSGIRLVACADAGGEAVLAAREVLRFVRDGGRFRDCAVLVRTLESHYRPLARTFRRYGIPFFLDRRESVAHHPLAELTRSALRTVAFDWQHDDWFAALKAGFSAEAEIGIARLENAALEFGWRGQKWLAPLSIPGRPELEKFAEPLRRKILPPFEHFAAQLARHGNQPTGGQLAEAVHGLWNRLRAESTLERWTASETAYPAARAASSAIHATVWEQMNAWLDNVALAFPGDRLPLREWLPVLEAGLAGMTVGVIPPALDQVLIGAVDRARNPDLRLALVLGVNESLFPAAPVAPAILTDADRMELEQNAPGLGPGLRERLARERYLGYIACTRSSERLIVTFARRDADDRALNPSSFVAHLRRIVPGLELEEFSGEIRPDEAEHVSEMSAWLAPTRTLRPQAPAFPDPACPPGWSGMFEFPALKSFAENLRRLREPDLGEGLSPVWAEKLFGLTLRTSVSRLEEFAQCPFRFFVHAGLRAEERKLFELDPRAQGSFQHEVLKIFHRQLSDAGRRWRDLAPAQAGEQVAKIAAALAADYRDGLLRADGHGRFTARVLADSLQEFVETLVAWMHGQYEFDPAKAELDFGLENSPAPAWELSLGEGHTLRLCGRIDRIDLYREADGRVLCVVMDYKSSRRKLDPLLVAHGIQLQLLAYLAAVSHWPDPRQLFGVASLTPAGAFYVSLRGQYEGGATRDEALAETDAARKRAYRHFGRFDVGALSRLDRAGVADQFSYRLNKDGTLRADSMEALPRADFERLLGRVEAQLREMGRAIFSGVMPVAPYRKGRETPCEFCDYRAVCRIDPWTHRYRVLRAEAP